MYTTPLSSSVAPFNCPHLGRWVNQARSTSLSPVYGCSIPLLKSWDTEVCANSGRKQGTHVGPDDKLVLQRLRREPLALRLLGRDEEGVPELLLEDASQGHLGHNKSATTNKGSTYLGGVHSCQDPFSIQVPDHASTVRLANLVSCIGVILQSDDDGVGAGLEAVVTDSFDAGLYHGKSSQTTSCSRSSTRVWSILCPHNTKSGTQV